MMIKTSELIGDQLDWAVATCEGYTSLRKNAHRFDRALIMTPPRKEYGPVFLDDLAYSGDWSIGGPIMDAQYIETTVIPAGFDPKEHPPIVDGDVWEAKHYPGDCDPVEAAGPTRLIAAMRCYVASKLGDEVDIPEELL